MKKCQLQGFKTLALILVLVQLSISASSNATEATTAELVARRCGQEVTGTQGILGLCGLVYGIAYAPKKFPKMPPFNLFSIVGGLMMWGQHTKTEAHTKCVNDEVKRLSNSGVYGYSPY